MYEAAWKARRIQTLTEQLYRLDPCNKYNDRSNGQPLLQKSTRQPAPLDVIGIYNVEGLFYLAIENKMGLLGIAG